MPFTPFHFGPGLAIKSLAMRKFSFLSFMSANVLIDVEPLYYMVRGEFPLHRFFHTYIGASVVGTVVILLLLVVKQVVLSMPVFSGNRVHVYFLSLSSFTISVGAFTGVYSHIFLDSVMHSDIMPLLPFSSSNGLLGLVSLSELHWFCILAGLFGILVLLGHRFFVRSF